MKGLAGLLLLLLLAGKAESQMTVGLTGKPDTSFTTYSAFQSARRKYPNIEMVKEQQTSFVKERRSVAYCNTGQRELHLDVFYPRSVSRKKIPGILIIYGGGWRSGNRSQHIPLAQRLAARGYVCYTAEYRLSTEALYPAAVYDLKAALRWIRAHSEGYHSDPSKIAVLGFSAGGELAAFLGTTGKNPKFEGASCNLNYSGNVQAVIDIDGTLSFVHPESGEGNDSRSISAATYWFGYPKREKLQLWEEASPLTYAGKNTPPFLFINSSVDRMHAGRDDLIKILTENGTYSEVHTFPDSPHTFCLFEPWFSPTVDYISAFLKKVFN